jgi:hypothetical protein
MRPLPPSPAAVPRSAARATLAAVAALAALAGHAAPLAGQRLAAAEIRERLEAGLPAAFELYREL